MPNQKGTGKHGHRDTQEPYPHSKQQGDESRGSHQQHAGESDRGSRQQDASSDESLRDREYRDEQGNVHHHTKSYMDQHGKGDKH
jgi:hypothetical protein